MICPVCESGESLVSARGKPREKERDEPARTASGAERIPTARLMVDFGVRRPASRRTLNASGLPMFVSARVRWLESALRRWGFTKGIGRRTDERRCNGVDSDSFFLESYCQRTNETEHACRFAKKLPEVRSPPRVETRPTNAPCLAAPYNDSLGNG